MRGVVVTGAAGRLGGLIAQRLLTQHPKCTVIATDIVAETPAWAAEITSGADGERLLFVPGVDLTDAAAVEAVFKRFHRITHCVHVAAWPGPSKHAPLSVVRRNQDADFKIGLENASPEQVLLDNTRSCWNVMKSAADHHCERVVFSSTLFTAGWCHDTSLWRPSRVPIDETDVPTPFETYGLSKIVGEQIARMVSGASNGKTSIVSLRFPNIIKSQLWHQLPWPAPPPPAAEAGGSTNAPPLVFAAYAHEDDVVEGHMRSLTAAMPAPDNTIILAAPDTRYDVPTATLLPPGTLFEPRQMASEHGDPSFGSLVDSTLCKQLLGLAPRSWRDSNETLSSASDVATVLPPPSQQGAVPPASASWCSKL
jgi:nucleoside-diphosphate-sugar epimerase